MIRTNYIKRTTHIVLALTCIGLLSFFNSCNFFEDELKQDKQLAYYRYQVYSVSDSIFASSGRVKAYKTIIENISEDDQLITPRKKNKLLSEVYTTMGAEYYDAKDVDNAVASSTLAIVLNSENQFAYYNRACMYQSLGEDSLAVEDYSRAISSDSKYVDAYYNRGIIYEKHTDFQLAVEDYSEAIELSPVYVSDIYNNRGNVYQVMEFYDRAISDYSKALLLDSTKSNVYCNRADAYFQQGDTKSAFEDYKSALESDPTNAAAINKVNSLKNYTEKKNL